MHVFPNPYAVHPGVAMVQKWIKELPVKPDVLSTNGSHSPSSPALPAKRAARVAQKEYNLGTNAASWIAERADAKGTEEDSPETYLKTAAEWVEAQYSGPRVALRPLYEQLMKIGFSLGKDVKACPGKTAVPLYRKHVFAQIKPATNTRIDLGFALRT